MPHPSLFAIPARPSDCLYYPSMLDRAIELAGKAGVSVAFDLASFEVVRANRDKLRALLASGSVACVFANEVRRGTLDPPALSTTAE